MLSNTGRAALILRCGAVLECGAVLLVHINERERVMNTKHLLKLSLMGLLAFSFVSFEAYANGNRAVQKAKTENWHAKSPSQSCISVAIGKFENSGNAPDEISRGIRTRIQQCVVGTMKFNVQEREHLKEAMRGRALNTGGVTNGEDDDVPVVIKIKPASYVVYGKVLSYNADKHVADISDVAYAFVKSTIELQVKIVDVKTARILSAKTVVGHGLGKVVVADSVKSSAGQGMRDAIDEASHAVADWLRDVFAFPAKVLKVEKTEITVDMNETEVKEGDVFDVIAEGGVIVDPDSGAALEIDGKCVGRVVITRPGSRMSKAEPVDGGRLSLEKIDTHKHAYKLRRVTTAAMINEARRRARQSHKTLSRDLG